MKKFIALTTAAAFLVSAAPAFATYNWSWMPKTITKVSSTNVATVMNDVLTTASTGGNKTEAGNAENTVSGKGTNGGNAANGGMGGQITTGNAAASSAVLNDVGYNSTEIDPCGCLSSGWKKTVTVVTNSNTSNVANLVGTGASTGENSTEGGDAENTVTGPTMWWFGSSSNGGNAANGGHGGVIMTGNATAGSSVVNYVGSNITKIN